MAKPLAIITCLEDSPPELDRRLVSAYLRTIYRVVFPAFDISIGPLSDNVEQWLAHAGLETFAFITAANPKSRILTDNQNSMRNEALFRELKRRIRASPHPAVHRSKNGDWPEEKSWWAPGLAPADAIDLGRRFEQNALVFWTKGENPKLWWL